MQHGRRYETIMATGRGFDGMFLELWDRPANALALEAFHADADGSIEFTRYRADVPPEVEAWFRAEAARRLPPLPDAEPGAAADGGGTTAFPVSWPPGPPPLLS